MFQCRERLLEDFYQAYQSGELVALVKEFQCRERLREDFYQATGGLDPHR